MEDSKNDIDSLKHLVQYHQEVGGETQFKSYLFEIHGRRLQVQQDLIMQATTLQEESLLLAITHKDIHQWAKSGSITLEKVEFIQEIQQDKGREDHCKELLSDERMTQIYLVAKHWAKIVDDLLYRVDEAWEHCNQTWTKRFS